MNKIPIVLATNDNYSKHAAVTIKSVVENSKSELFFGIFSSNLNAQNIEKLKLCAQPNELKIFEINKDVFSNLKVDLQFKHITIETCYRYLIPDLLPEFSKCIYLDCDTIALGDVSEFFSTDISDYYAAAVNEQPKLENPYFNAGVLLLNCDKIRENNISAKLFEKTKELNGISTLLDQDVLNEVFCGHVKYISPKWNLEPPLFGNNRVSDKTEKESIINNPGIIHFSGPNKPWIVPNGIAADPFSAAFFYYLRKTPYAEFEQIYKQGHNKFYSWLKYIRKNPLFFLKKSHRLKNRCRKNIEENYR